MENCGASNVTDIIPIHLLAQAYHTKVSESQLLIPQGNTVDYMALGNPLIKTGNEFFGE